MRNPLFDRWRADDGCGAVLQHLLIVFVKSIGIACRHQAHLGKVLLEVGLVTRRAGDFKQVAGTGELEHQAAMVVCLLLATT